MKQSAEPFDLQSIRSYPPDTTPYLREAVPEDYPPAGTGGPLPGVFIVDVVVNNTNPDLPDTETAGDGETSIAVNLADSDEIVIAAFSGSWGANAPIYHSTDGGFTWTRQLSVPVPPGWPTNCPCDWTWDYGRNNQLSAAILANSPTVPGGKDVVSGTTTNPAQSASFNYFDPPGPPVQAQETNINLPNSLGGVDQPWLLVNPDPFTPAQDNVYVAYDDFNDTDNFEDADMRVAVSYGQNPPNFTVDVQVGNALGNVNPGLRLAEDPRTGFMWALWGRHIGPGAGGGSKNMDYMLNRTVDGGATWSLNGNAFGIIVVNADSTQPTPKFGTVNALLGGVHHAAVDPVTGDLYYVYGNRNAGTGKDRLAIRRVSGDGAGGVIIGAQSFVTGEVEAAIPVVGVTDNGTVGVFYYTFDGFSSDDFPVFTAHLALSEDQGATFTTLELVTFLSVAQDCNVDPSFCLPGADPNRQRVLGDYMQMQVVDNCFYGSFTANGVPFGRTVANHDPIFFRVCVGPQIQVPGSVIFADTCVGDTGIGTLEVCNTGIENLVVEPITSSNEQFSVEEPSSGYPVVISPDFCFPFEVLFSPDDVGDQAATLTIPSNDSVNPSLDVEATGTVPEPDIGTVMADGGDFGNVCVGDFRDLDLIINNGGGCNLTVIGISSDSPEFRTRTLTPHLVIGPADSVGVPIRFAPADFGPVSATLTIASDDPDSPTEVQVEGNAPHGEIVVTGSTDFGDVCAETLAEKTLGVCNVGPCNLQVTGASIDCNDFTLINDPFRAPVSPDFCLDLVIRFTPTSAGPKTCILTITSDDQDTPEVMRVLTANTPFASIDVPPDHSFPPTVIQSVGACESAEPFPVSNTGACNLEIIELEITENSDEYSLAGLPSFPIILQPGHQAGSGDLNTVFPRCFAAAAG